MTATIREFHEVNGTLAIFACSKCGALKTPHMTVGDPQYNIEIARLQAIDCINCEPAAVARTYQNNIDAMIDRAVKVSDLGACFSDRGDAFYPDPEDAAYAGETGVFGAIFHPHSICISQIIESALNDHHEDADQSDLVDIDALEQAIAIFNQAQTGGSYTMDVKKWQCIEQPRTFAMIKPDATARGDDQAIMADIQAAGFHILKHEKRRLKQSEAEWLYQEHNERDHFSDLVAFTISDDVVLMLIEGDHDNVPTAFRGLMGATDPKEHKPGTLRHRYATGLRENAIHGSDGPSAAINEMAYFNLD